GSISEKHEGYKGYQGPKVRPSRNQRTLKMQPRRHEVTKNARRRECHASTELQKRFDGLTREWRVTVESTCVTDSSLLAFGSRDSQSVVLKVLRNEGDEWRSGAILEAFEQGRRVYSDLCGSQRHRQLLHGDLHHYNVLFDARRGWLAIDPKGVVGELEYEVGAALRNPYEAPELFLEPSTIERRVEQF